MSEVSERHKQLRMTQPIIFKWLWLQISHDHSWELGEIKRDGSSVINVYWGRHCDKWLFSKTPELFNFALIHLTFRYFPHPKSPWLEVHSYRKSKTYIIPLSLRSIFRKLKTHAFTFR